MHIRRAVKVLRSFIALFHNPSRAADAAPGAHRSRKARYVRYVADATPAWRLICFIACFGLLLSSRPVLPASMGKSAEKTKARLTQGPPGLNLPNLNEARRMRASAPKIAPPVSATFASKVTPPAPAPLSLQEDNLLMALIDQRNRVGTSGEDLLSRNFNWGASIVSLPGRAGLGLNISLSLNSLIWTKSGTNMHFNLDRGFPSPGFRLGFPELGAAFNNTETGTASRLITMPSGWRYEFRENPSLGPNVYEEMGGTRMLLVIKPGTFNFRDTVWTLLLTDGTAYKFKIPTNGNNPKCIEVKDRNGNFISVAYTAFERISAVTDALGRVVNFNYDDSNRLISITQNWGGGTHTYATFAYDNVTIQTNFLGLNTVGASNGTVISVLSRVDMADGKVYAFEHNPYAQVKTIRCYAPNSANPGNFPDDYTLLSSISYDLRTDAGGPKSDCPRFFSRTDWAKDWNAGVVTSFDGDGATWGAATAPDGTVYKEFFGDSGWQRGLTLRTETWSNNSLKRWATMAWDNDNPNVSYWLNPRMTETNVYDDTGNRRRTKIDYADFGAVSDIREYDAPPNTSAVLRRTHFEYLRGTAYTGNLKRRLTQLVTSQKVYDGSDALYSKVTYEYDLGGEYLVNEGPPISHDTTNFGLSFVQGRGDLNVVRRWDVTAPDDVNKSVASTMGYNTSGSVIFSRDPLGHKTSMSYADSFSDSIIRNTFAYPTETKDADQNPSVVQYNYDFGAVMRTQDPKGAAVTWTYDAAGRVERVRNEVNGAYTRYVYAPNHTYVQSFTTINDLEPANEFYSITVFNGHGRATGTASDHPTSVGKYKAQTYIYDVMGRLAQQSNPTEINVSWVPAGDDAAGWVWTYQSYDWQGRPKVTTNQDGTTTSVSYEGCGCAGGQKVVLTDEVGRRTEQNFDILGRMWRERTYNWGGSNESGIYSTTITTYNALDQVTRIRGFQGAGTAPGDESCPTGSCQETTMAYDGHQRLLTRKHPIESAATSFAYNADDTLQTTTDARGVTTAYAYNNRRLVTSITYGAAAGVIPLNPITFGYDEMGNRLWMDDQPGRVDYHYNALSQIEWEERRFDDLTQSYRLSYEYNLAGQVKSVTDPWGARATYVFNKAGEITDVTGDGYADDIGFTNRSVSQFTTGVKYRAWGAFKSFTNGNFTEPAKKNFSLDYNARLQLTRFDGGGRITEHTFYNDGRVKDVIDNTYSNFNRAQSYDHLGRLASASAGTTTPKPYNFTYGYNEWSNTTSRTGSYWVCNPPNFTASYINSRNTRMSYDSAGNVLRPGAGVTDATMQYDAASRLAAVRDLESLTSPYSNSTYVYDGDGRLAREGFQLENSAHFFSFTYNIRSSVLGGAKIAYVWSNNSYTEAKGSSSVYLGGQEIAYQIYNRVTNGPLQVVWVYLNPVIRSRYEHSRYDYVGGTTDMVHAEAVVDPVGAHVDRTNPCVPPAPTDPPSIISQRYGSVSDFAGTCIIDGIVGPCDVAMGLINSGAAVVVPGGQTTRYNYQTQQFEFFRAFANGFQGFLPMGATPNDRGFWGEDRLLQQSDDDINKLIGAVGSASIRNAAKEYYKSRKKCIEEINKALAKAKNGGFKTIEEALEKTKFVDLTDPANANLNGINSMLAQTGESSLAMNLGPRLRQTESYAFSAHENKRLINPTTKEPIPTVFFGETFAKRAMVQGHVPAHEVLHPAFNGNHASIATALGLKYDVNNEPYVGSMKTDLNARDALDKYIFAGCDPSSSAYGFNPVPPPPIR